MTRQTRPILELLEDRCVPVTWGNPWPDAAHLTVSFAPDGTQIGDRTNELSASLGRTMPAQQWQTEILRALQTWAAHANINISVVSDAGLPFGVAGRPQGDPRFGDIRIGAYAMSSEVIAISSPFELAAGTWAGDIKLNSAYKFGANGSGKVDLYTAMLHEVAHVLGLDHSSDPASAVFADYKGPKTGLTSQDIARIQDLYGVRGHDEFEGSRGNDVIGRSSELSLLKNPDGSLGIEAAADLTTQSDVDYYTFRAPLNTGSLQIHLRTEGVSLLAPRLTVYDSNKRVVKSVSASGTQDGDLLVEIGGLNALKTYYVKVDGATNDAFGVGSYQLQVRGIPLLGKVNSLLTSIVSTVNDIVSDDLHTNDSFFTASLLGILNTQTASKFDIAYKGKIRDSWDVDFYKIQAPRSSDSNVMSVMLWGTDNGGLVARASVYDANRRLVPAQVVVNENGIFNIQITNATPGASYYVKVEAADSKGAHNTGSYFLGVDFGGQPVKLHDIADGKLSAADPQNVGRLVIRDTEMFHFVLSATANSDAAVRMTVHDAKGNVVAVLVAATNEPAVTRTVLLPKGVYTIRFTGGTADGKPLPRIVYDLDGNRLSDPIGPQQEDTTENPSDYNYSNPNPPEEEYSYDNDYYYSYPQENQASSDPYYYDYSYADYYYDETYYEEQYTTEYSEESYDYYYEEGTYYYEEDYNYDYYYYEESYYYEEEYYYEESYYEYY